MENKDFKEIENLFEIKQKVNNNQVSNEELIAEIEKLKKEVERRQRVTNSVYSKIKNSSLIFLLNSNISKEDKELFKETFSDFL